MSIMKKSIIVLFLIALIQFTSAQEKEENFNSYSDLELSLEISSALNLVFTEQNPKIEYIKADLSFFPRNDGTQQVLNLETISNPLAEITSTEEKLTYEWPRAQANVLTYGLNSKIKTFSKISKVNKKIAFPVKNIPDEFLIYTKPTEFIDLTQDIEKKAYEIIGGERDLYKVIFKLADWTRNNINYNLSTLTAEAVQKSSWVLQNKRGVCDEITNLFISFLRTIGIPARFVSGMVYTNLNYDWGAHGWAEVYFPEFGWVPFDVTFGQYGWLDPSHIKLKDDIDSGSPSAEFSWRSYGAEVKPQEINLKTNLIQKGQNIDYPISLSVEPLRKAANFGSYIPMQIAIENLRDYYASTSIIVRKAPGLTEKNVKEILLEPREIKRLFWILEIPSDLEKGYIYTSILEISSSFGNNATSQIRYSDQYETYSLDSAKKITESLARQQEKSQLSTINLDCGTDKRIYYSNETATVECNVKNLAQNKVNIELCLIEKCERIYLEPRETKKTSFKTEVSTSGRIAVTAENEDGIKFNYIEFDVIKIPDVYVTDINPSVIDYKDDVKLKFTINSDSEIYDLMLDFGFGKFSQEKFKGEREIFIETNGKSLIQGLKFHISYKDLNGKIYERDEALHIEVQNIPWYAKIIFWVINLF